MARISFGTGRSPCPSKLLSASVFVVSIVGRGGGLSSSPPPHRHTDPGQKPSDKQKGCLCGAHRLCSIEPDTWPETEARPLSIESQAGTCDRRIGRVASLLLFIAMWMMLSYLACVLACRV
nr:hypothetical protein [Pandoravirus aubagnensis]